MLANQFDRPVIVHRYPVELKAFYFKHDATDPRWRWAWTCSRPRVTGRSSAAVSARMISRCWRSASPRHHLPREAFSWYLDLRRYGTVPHAGFGLGVERTVAWVCGLHHVRETIPFARMMERITP